MRRPIVLLSIAILCGIALGSCGDDDDTDAAPVDDRSGSSGIEVVARDIEFDEDTYDATAGTFEVTYRNEGSITHTLVIDDVDGFKLEVTGNGDEDRATVELEPGNYTLYCDVPGHRQAGMEATLEVS